MDHTEGEIVVGGVRIPAVQVDEDPPQWALDAIRAVMELRYRVVRGEFADLTTEELTRKAAKIIAFHAPLPGPPYRRGNPT